jgi:hypothetical protein
MAGTREETGVQNRMLIGAIWLSGVALFVVELTEGLNYLQARLASLAPNFLGFVPATAVATWKLAENAFWNYGQLVRTFQIVPFVTLPFLLVGLALVLRYKLVFQKQNGPNEHR